MYESIISCITTYIMDYPIATLLISSSAGVLLHSVYKTDNTHTQFNTINKKTIYTSEEEDSYLADDDDEDGPIWF